MPPKKRKDKNDSGIVSMPLVNPNAAGIDIGSTLHAVAVPAGRDIVRVKSFGTMTCDLEAIVAWLHYCNIDTVAMESTGIYWKSLFKLLTCRGFEVYLVNAKEVKNVSGRKTDQDDALWIQKLHSCGLLKSSYLPDSEQETLRTLIRYRKSLVEDSSRFIQRIQKSLESMNIKIQTVISDITGATGRRIIESILAGERDPKNFLVHLDKRIKADHDTIVKSLQGNWSDEHLFIVKESYKIYNFYKDCITECDAQIKKQLEALEALQNQGIIEAGNNAFNHERKTLKKRNKNYPDINIREFLEKIHGVDVLEIYGLSHVSALEILAETGTDLSKWETEKHFVSWLNLCPNNKISGGKLISSQVMRKKPNPASQAFRSAANAVQKGNHWLGDYFRRMRSKGGNKYAIVATANKIATIYYKMVRYKKEFNPVDLEQYQEKYKQAKIAFYEKKLLDLKKQVA
jgi:transposase